ncbi:MAG TPA: hypothetical protein VKB18_08875 [Gemmatimonadota bacterium]|nr:hypothetical protein [Gemmatimonadota bacterium]
MKPLPLPARVLARIAEMMRRGSFAEAGPGRLRLIFVGAAAGTLLVLFGRPFGPVASRGLLAVVGLACWVGMLAVMRNGILKTGGRGGPALRLAGIWLTGAGFTAALVDPTAGDGAFAFDFAVALLLAFLCYGKWVLFMRAEEEREEDLLP